MCRKTEELPRLNAKVKTMKIIFFILFFISINAYASLNRTVIQCPLATPNEKIVSLLADQGFNFGEDYFFYKNGARDYLVKDASNDAMPTLLAIECNRDKGFLFVSTDAGSGGLGILHWYNHRTKKIMELRFSLRADSFRVSILPDAARVLLINAERTGKNKILLQKNLQGKYEEIDMQDASIPDEFSAPLPLSNYRSPCDFSSLNGKNFSGSVTDKTDVLGRHVATDNKGKKLLQKRFVSQAEIISKRRLDQDKKMLNEDITERFLKSDFSIHQETSNRLRADDTGRDVELRAEGPGIDKLCELPRWSQNCSGGRNKIFSQTARLLIEDATCPGRAKIRLDEKTEMTLRQNGDGQYYFEKFSDYWTRLYKIRRD